MIAKEFTCRVADTTWLTPTVFRLRFETLKKMPFQSGQFISVVVPGNKENPISAKRCYSLASAPAEATKKGYYELCVKYVAGGRGTAYLASLGAGDTFQVFGPFGHMQYQPKEGGRSVCFISTGTGIAPLRSIMYSAEFQAKRPKSVLCLVGIRTDDEVIYKSDLDALKVQTVYAVSKPSSEWEGFRGRVTDFLKTLPTTWNWHSTDFYICGSGEMVSEVAQFLVGARGVSPSAICKEAFTPSHKGTAAPEKSTSKKESRSLSAKLFAIKTKSA